MLAFILVQVAHPLITELVFSIPVSAKEYIAVVILLYFLTDTVRSIYKALDLRNAILNYSNYPLSKYYEIIMKNKKMCFAFPYLLLLNAGFINRDVRSIFNGRINKIKDGLKSRLH